jgi:mannose-1-phosphate guanylyltransferase/mannose-6-phosphate isomerase
MTSSTSLIHPVILSGGSGTRLWPLSRDAYPKQLLALLGQDTLLQATVQRAASLASSTLRVAAPLLICNQEHRFLIREQCQAIGCSPAALYLEPAGRNTAPAIALAALHLARGEGDAEALMLVLPADHVIRNQLAFTRAVEAAAEAAKAGYLATFGITPTHAETGYGYIQRGAALATLPGAEQLDRFVEKPDVATAEAMLASGRYCWNSGMFLFTAGRYLDELQKHNPAMLAAVERAWQQRTADLGFLRPDADAFLGAPADSIDYAIMQRTQRAAVVPADIGWSDVGSWESLWQVAEKDGNGNVLQGDVLATDTGNSYLRSEGRLLVVLGLRNVVVVQTKDATLVMDKTRAQQIKPVVEALRQQGRPESAQHVRVYRPWGWYESIDSGERFQVKRIMVKPGEKLSLQMHHHRAEHWVVVSGTAKVTVDSTETLLVENQSAFIPLGSVHRLENPGKVPLHLIEVQSGSYLGEDDIVRLIDSYGR